MKMMRKIFRGTGYQPVSRVFFNHGLVARATIAAAIAIAALFFLGASTLQPHVEKPTSVIDKKSCVTADCHANIKSNKVTHGPVNVNECAACHTLTSASEHKFQLTRDKKDLCTFCHTMEIPKNFIMHKPVAQGDCLGCHDPHGGTTNKFLRGKTMADTCFKCHENNMLNKHAVHGPIASGSCGACHMAHAAPQPKLLAVSGKDLCLSCHSEMKTQLAGMKFQHKPVAEADCLKCHDPHASDFAMQTKKATADLCESCHEQQKKAVTVALHKHTVVTEGKACINCHNPHGSNLAKLMKNDSMDVCMKCHVNKITAKDGRVIPAIAEVLDPKMSKHGPIREKNCAGCHEPHGSDNSRLLVKAYPETFYQGFSLEKFDLCFKCHDSQLVLAEKANGLTGFRNGDRNLHFVHVNKADRGRNCRACHETHASEHDLHIRNSVPYGKWEMPINFAKTSSGGGCAPGCHKELHYDRVNPVEYKNDATTQPAPTTAPTPQDLQPVKAPVVISAAIDVKEGKP